MGKSTDVNILIIGHSEHGKSEVAQAICNYFGWTEGESSYVCKEIVYEELLKRGYKYPTPHDAWLDRRNIKQVFKEIIKEYNTGDLARLTRKIFSDNEIYVGQRDGEEFTAAFMEGEFDVIIYVDAWKRIPNFDPSNLDIPKGMAHIVIDNNGTFEELHKNIEPVIHYLSAFVEFKEGDLSLSNEFRYALLWERLKHIYFNVQGPTVEELEEADEWLAEMVHRLTK